MFHRHDFGPWWQEYRDEVYERSDHRFVNQVLFNNRRCKDESCRYVQSRQEK